MLWDIDYTDEYGHWFARLSKKEQKSIAKILMLLEIHGAQLGYQHLESLKMKGLIS